MGLHYIQLDALLSQTNPAYFLVFIWSEISEVIPENDFEEVEMGSTTNQVFILVITMANCDSILKYITLSLGVQRCTHCSEQYTCNFKRVFLVTRSHSSTHIFLPLTPFFLFPHPATTGFLEWPFPLFLISPFGASPP